MATKSILSEKSLAFAIRSAKCYKYLTENHKEFVLSKQFLKCSTSIGANIRESRNAESSSDFIHKLWIAQKEADETLYWLEVLYQASYKPQNNMSPYQVMQRNFRRWYVVVF